MSKIHALIVAASLSAAPPALAGEVHVHGGWTAATDTDAARLYIEIENEGTEPVAVTGFATDLGRAELVAPALTGAREAVPLGAYPLDPGAVLEMEPAGVHVLLTGLAAPLAEGDRFEVRVMVEPGGEAVAHVLVEGPDAESEDHSGHDH